MEAIPAWGLKLQGLDQWMRRLWIMEVSQTEVLVQTCICQLLTKSLKTFKTHES